MCSTLGMIKQLILHQDALKNCRRCPEMNPPVILGHAADATIMMVGQAPGIHEAKTEIRRPFGWTAGKKLFQWYASIGVEEATFRQHVYMAAVCRCFPGKNPKGSGDRVPHQQEIANCREWLEKEYQILQPKLIIPVGKLAISQYMPVKKLDQVIGQQFVIDTPYLQADCIPLPHPSGLSTWYHTEPGKTLLKEALALMKRHSAWKALQAKANHQ